MPKLFLKIYIFFMVTTFFSLKLQFYYVNGNKSCKKHKIVQFYIKASPYQKWTFIKCPKPKKILKLL